ASAKRPLGVPTGRDRRVSANIACNGRVGQGWTTQIHQPIAITDVGGEDGVGCQACYDPPHEGGHAVSQSNTWSVATQSCVPVSGKEKEAQKLQCRQSPTHCLDHALVKFHCTLGRKGHRVRASPPAHLPDAGDKIIEQRLPVVRTFGLGAQQVLVSNAWLDAIFIASVAGLTTALATIWFQPHLLPPE